MKPLMDNYSVDESSASSTLVEAEDSSTEYFVRSPLLEALKEHFTKYYASEVQEMR